MQRLLVGIQSFDMLRKENLIYVDKTEQIYNLVTNLGYYFFISRPRRFGKSLLISTLKELFLGNKQLFEGLWIHTSNYSWKEHHVIHLDFSMISGLSPQEFRSSLHTNLIEEIIQIGIEYGISLDAFSGLEGKFKYLVRQLIKTKPVVLLIDEYDSPLLRHVNDIPMMQKSQDILRSFYATVKGLGGDISFLFMTGVTKFSKTSMFSGFNNLKDLTLDSVASTLLGCTDDEIDKYFAEHMSVIAQNENISVLDVKNNMRHWYNGYRFSEAPITVYNPFSTLMYLDTQRISNYWFTTDTPFFLVNLIKERGDAIEDLDGIKVPEDTLSASFDLDSMEVVPLMLQTGYLTIREYEPTSRRYLLGYPNEETKVSFLRYFVQTIFKIQSAQINNVAIHLNDSINTHDLQTFFSILQTFFASIPYTIQLPFEKYYQTIFYVVLSLFGVHTDSEVTTNDGRIDCIINTNDHIYIFEFKINDSAESALQQIEDKKYHQKFLHKSKKIVLIGASFDTQTRNIDQWMSKELA